VSGTDSYEMARRTVYVEPVSGRQNREKYRVNREKLRKLSRPLQEALIYRGFLSFFAMNKNRDEFTDQATFERISGNGSLYLDPTRAPFPAGGSQ
jgi:hypothetical protein